MVFLWLPVLTLVAIAELWLVREFRAEAERRCWAGTRKRNLVLKGMLLGPLYLWSLRREGDLPEHT